MNADNRVDLDLGRRVKEFLERHWGELTGLLGPAIQGLTVLKAKLDAAVAEAKAVAEGQILGSRKTVVKTRKGLRRSLYKHYLRALHQMSVLIRDANPNATTGISLIIELPPERANEEVIIAAANAAMQQARANIATFEQFGMPEGFLDQMQSLLDAIASAQTSKDSFTNIRVQSTATIQSSLRRVKFIVRCIRPLLGPALDRADTRYAALQSGWDNASRRHQVPTSVQEDTQTTNPTTSATGNAS